MSITLDLFFIQDVRPAGSDPQCCLAQVIQGNHAKQNQFRDPPVWGHRIYFVLFNKNYFAGNIIVLPL